MKNFHLAQKKSKFIQLNKLTTKVNIYFFNIKNIYFRIMKQVKN